MQSLEFFMPMNPPTTTHQQKQVNFKTKHFYEPEDLKIARNKLMAHLGRYAPEEKLKGPIRLVVKWCFAKGESHRDGEWKITKPDTDNLNKLLKDCMTDIGFWKDDAEVASELIEKFWAKIPGIYIFVGEMENEI